MDVEEKVCIGCGLSFSIETRITAENFFGHLAAFLMRSDTGEIDRHDPSCRY